MSEPCPAFASSLPVTHGFRPGLLSGRPAVASSRFLAHSCVARTAPRRCARVPLRMQAGDDGDDAEDEAPSDSYVPPGSASAVMDAVSGGAASRSSLSTELLTIAAKTARGQYATSGQRSRVDTIVGQLEELNPNRSPVETDLIDGEWVLLFGPTFFGKSPILALAAKPLLQIGQVRQTISVDDGRLVNEVDLVAFPEVSMIVKTTARLTPVGGDKFEVSVEKTTVTGGSIAERFDLGGLTFDVPVERIYQRIKGTAPETSIETTFLDEKIRISRSKDRKLYVYARA